MSTLYGNSFIAPYNATAGRRESWNYVGGSVNGSILEGSSVTINGLGFGANGPSIHLFEDFSGGLAGTAITTGNSNFDIVADAETNKSIPFFTSDARSGTVAADIYKEDELVSKLDCGPMSCTFDYTNEIYVSYALKCPDGSKWPGNPLPAEEEFPDDSNFKFLWLIDSINGPSGTYNDIALFTNVSNTFDMNGNVLSLGTIPNGTTHWRWDIWNRFSFWIKANIADPSGAAGNLYWQIINAAGHNAQGTTPIIFSGSSGAPNKWDRATFAANARVGLIGDGRKVLMDDCYLATGAYAAARVELGNASTYAACTKLALCEALSWGDTAINITVHSGDLNLAAATWIYITLPDNATRFSGQVVTP